MQCARTYTTSVFLLRLWIQKLSADFRMLLFTRYIHPYFSLILLHMGKSWWQSYCHGRFLSVRIFPFPNAIIISSFTFYFILFHFNVICFIFEAFRRSIENYFTRSSWCCYMLSLGCFVKRSLSFDSHMFRRIERR